MPDRRFVQQIVRKGLDAEGGEEVVTLGTGVDHGDGTATMTPAPGLPFGRKGAEDPTVLVDIAELTTGYHGPVSAQLVYEE